MLSVTSRGVFRFFFFSPRHVGWFKNIPCLVSCGVSWSPLCLASSLACARRPVRAERPARPRGAPGRGARGTLPWVLGAGRGRRLQGGRVSVGSLTSLEPGGQDLGSGAPSGCATLGRTPPPLGLGFLVCNARGLKEGERSGFIQQLRRLRLKRDWSLRKGSRTPGFSMLTAPPSSFPFQSSSRGGTPGSQRPGISRGCFLSALRHPGAEREGRWRSTGRGGGRPGRSRSHRTGSAQGPCAELWSFHLPTG